MATQKTLPVKVTPFKTIQDFFAALEQREYIRLVKVADQGLVEPAKRGSARCGA